MRVLGIETSCDETAASVVRDGRWIESNVVASQIELHQSYGGVVPERAARAHIETIVPVVREAIGQARIDWDQLDAVAVTQGPGLAGCLLVGLNVAKGIALARDLPLVPVNHLEAHIYANWLVPQGRLGHEGQVPPEPEFPLLCLVVSGGHTELVLMESHGRYQHLGRTRDDAAGEAFDKAARLLGLGYPGGPAIQEAARQGDPMRHPLPRAWLGDSYDFSFSGLKTAVLHLMQQTPRPTSVADVAASFQEAVAEVLAVKTARAAQRHEVRQIALAGGVAANLRLRQEVQARLGRPPLVPPVALCTDNAAMVAAAAYFLPALSPSAALSLDAIPNFPLVAHR